MGAEQIKVYSMAAVNTIEIVLLFLIWFGLNLSLFRDWVVERKEHTPEVNR